MTKGKLVSSHNNTKGGLKQSNSKGSPWIIQGLPLELLYGARSISLQERLNHFFH